MTRHWRTTRLRRLALASSVAFALASAGVAGAQPRDWTDARRDTTVVVHIDSAEPVDLEREDVTGDWSVVCTSPCDRRVPEHPLYRIAALGVRDSDEFWLQGHGSRRVELAVRPTPSAWLAVGYVLASVGGVLFAAGGLIVGTSLHDTQTYASRDTTVAGITVLVVGALAVAAGLYEVFTHPASPVAIRALHPKDPIPARQPPTMAWSNAARTDASQPLTLWLPLLTKRF
jgi:hypothetical protein